MARVIHEIESKKYVEVNREAKEGDLIIVTSREKHRCPGDCYDKGHVGVVEEVGHDEVFADFSGQGNSFTHGAGRWWVGGNTEGDFAVIEVMDDYEEESPSPSSDRDLIVELAYSVAKLQRELDQLKRESGNLTVAVVDGEELSEKVEMLIDDVVTLDERTQPLIQPPKKSEESEPKAPITKDTSRIDEILRKRGDLHE